VASRRVRHGLRGEYLERRTQPRSGRVLVALEGSPRPAGPRRQQLRPICRRARALCRRSCRPMSGMTLQTMRSAKAIQLVANNYCPPPPRGVNLRNAAFPPFIGSGICPGRAPSDRGFFFMGAAVRMRGTGLQAQAG